MAAPERVILEIISRDSGGGGPPSGGDGDEGPLPRSFSEDSLAVRLVDELGGDWRCADGQWHRWDNKRWERDSLKKVWHQSRLISRGAASEIGDNRLALRIQTKSTIFAVVALAGVDPRVATRINDFDRDPWLLNTPAGILDLRSGQLGPHRREAMMTKTTGAGPGGECPHFMRYLNEATGGDEALQRYLQRVAGYCLTGSIEEHCILFFHGPGGSGKSTFLLVVQDLLGDYAVNSPMNAFTVATGERHPTELAHFAGARVVTASEIEEGMRWDEGKLKAISGGDKITARFMRGDFFTFEPQFKLLLAGNHRPRMRSADDAMRRRMQVIPFKHKPATVDKSLREKLQAELGGILCWAVEGEIERRRMGLKPPRVVTEATDEYFKSENTIGRWLDERCTLDRERFTSTKELYRDFQEWARGVGEFVVAERIFSEKLDQTGHVQKGRDPSGDRRGFRGVALLAVDSGGSLFGSPGSTSHGGFLPGHDDPAEQWSRE